MRLISRPARLALLSLVASSGLFVSSALGSGFVVARFGGEHGHPMTDNPTAIYYNPAGLSLLGGTRLMIDGTLAWRMVDYTRPAESIGSPGVGTPDEAAGANSGTAELRNFAGSPFIGIASDLGIKGFGISAAFFAPMGGGASWSTNSDFEGSALGERYPGAQDGVQRWWSIDSTLRVLYGSLAVSYQLLDGLHLGASYNYVMSDISTIRARNSDGSDDLVLGDRLKEGRSFLDAKGTGHAFGFGLIYQPDDTLTFGYSYQSQPGGEEMRLEGDLKIALLDSPVDPSSSSEVALLQSYPDIHRFGVRYRVSPELELRLFGDYTRWSHFDRQCVVNEGSRCPIAPDGSLAEDAPVVLNIQRDWVDAFGIRTGASWWMSPETELYLGLGYDGSAVPDEAMDPSLFDMDKITLALGAKWALLDRSLFLALTYTQVFYMSREVEVGLRELKPPSAGPDSGGTYEQAVGVTNLNLEWRFGESGAVAAAEGEADEPTSPESAPAGESAPASEETPFSEAL